MSQGKARAKCFLGLAMSRGSLQKAVVRSETRLDWEGPAGIVRRKRSQEGISPSGKGPFRGWLGFGGQDVFSNYALVVLVIPHPCPQCNYVNL